MERKTLRPSRSENVFMLLLQGDSGVGKTTFLSLFRRTPISGQFFDAEFSGYSYPFREETARYIFEESGVRFTFLIFDSLHELEEYADEPDAVILMYDITKIDSLKSCEEKIRSNRNPEILVLVGTKTDLDTDRKVPTPAHSDVEGKIRSCEISNRSKKSAIEALRLVLPQVCALFPCTEFQSKSQVMLSLSRYGLNILNVSKPTHREEHAHFFVRQSLQWSLSTSLILTQDLHHPRVFEIAMKDDQRIWPPVLLMCPQKQPFFNLLKQFSGIETKKIRTIQVRAVEKCATFNSLLLSYRKGCEVLGISALQTVEDVFNEVICEKETSMGTIEKEQDKLEQETNIARVLNFSAAIRCLGDKQWKALGDALLWNGALQSLDLSNTQLSSDILGSAPMTLLLERHVSLTSLNLSSNRLGERSGAILGQAIRINSLLKKLKLGSIELTDEGGRNLFSALKANQSITALSLPNNKLGQLSALVLANVLKGHSTLKRLDLRCNYFTEDDIQQIVKGSLLKCKFDRQNKLWSARLRKTWEYLHLRNPRSPTHGGKTEKGKKSQRENQMEEEEESEEDLEMLFKDKVDEKGNIFESEKITRGKEIGSGNFGTVYRGEWCGRTVALKRISGGSFSNEVEMMRALPTHPCVVKFFGTTQRVISSDSQVTNKPDSYDICYDSYYLVMEWVENGDLATFMNNRQFTSDEMGKILIQIAEGIVHLHNNHIVHKDLGARNILIGNGLVVKLSDFGMARKLEKQADGSLEYRSRGAGDIPFRYMAPESIGGTFSVKSDVWTFANVGWELFTASFPYPSYDSPKQVLEAIEAGIGQKFENCHAPEKVRKLFSECQQKEPKNRPEMAEVLKILKDIYKKKERKIN